MECRDSCNCSCEVIDVKRHLLEVIWFSSRDPEYFNWLTLQPSPMALFPLCLLMCFVSDPLEPARQVTPSPSFSIPEGHRPEAPCAHGRGEEAVLLSRQNGCRHCQTVISLAVFAWIVVWPAWGEGLHLVQQQNFSRCSLPLCCHCDGYISLL